LVAGDQPPLRVGGERNPRAEFVLGDDEQPLDDEALGHGEGIGGPRGSARDGHPLGGLLMAAGLRRHRNGRPQPGEQQGEGDESARAQPDDQRPLGRNPWNKLHGWAPGRRAKIISRSKVWSQVCSGR